MYQVYSQNGRVTIESGKGSIRTLSEAKREALSYVDAYSHSPREARWARLSIRTLTKDRLTTGSYGVDY